MAGKLTQLKAIITSALTDRLAADPVQGVPGELYDGHEDIA